MSKSSRWRSWVGLVAVAGLIVTLGAACQSDPVGSISEDRPPAATAVAQARGIAFGTFNLDTLLLDAVLTGTMRGGGLTPKNLPTMLAAVRKRGGRIVIKLCMGRDQYVQNADRTFSFAKWKAEVGKYQAVNLAPYIADGTIIGHYLIDEPHRAQRWGGKAIPQATIEAMAAYSKSLWPELPTFVRVAPSWLGSAPVTYTALDAGWLQFEKGKGDPVKWVAAEAAVARRLGLGIAVGMNVLDGGNGSSGIRGYTPGMFAMSATEMRTVGTAMLANSLACAFYMWTYDASYFGRADVKSAMAALSLKAQAHVRTSCRQ